MGMMPQTHPPIYLFSLSSDEEAISIPSLDITFFKPDIDFSACDAFILTSKQAVAALEQYPKELYMQKKALCISKATAEAFSKIGGEILEVGKGYGDSLYETVKKYPKSMRWLYLRAKEVASSFAKNLRSDGYRIEESVLYKSECSQAIQSANVAKEAILIFTSPSSVRCYMQNHTFSKGHTVIVIGKTTARALPKEIPFLLAPEPTIKSCMQIAKNISL